MSYKEFTVGNRKIMFNASKKMSGKEVEMFEKALYEGKKFVLTNSQIRLLKDGIFETLITIEMEW